MRLAGSATHCRHNNRATHINHNNKEIWTPKQKKEKEKKKTSHAPMSAECARSFDREAAKFKMWSITMFSAIYLCSLFSISSQIWRGFFVFTKISVFRCRMHVSSIHSSWFCRFRFDWRDSNICRGSRRFRAEWMNLATISRPTLACSVDRWPARAASQTVHRHFPVPHRNRPTK